MGTRVECLLDVPPRGAVDRAFRAVEAELVRLEGMLSRFRPESELSALNRQGRLRVGDELCELVGLALEARERTGGRFDPTLHDAVCAAGYDRPFDRLAADAVPRPGPRRRAGTVVVDEARRVVSLTPGTRLDLGGIAKGWAADRALRLLEPVGPALVNIGGDLAATARADDAGWPVGLVTPEGVVTLGLPVGGLATSGRDRRRWRQGGEERHHLIDPRTGRPAASDVLRVTVCAATATAAEVTATALFLAGAEAARAEADREGIPAVIVTGDGRTLRAGGLQRAPARRSTGVGR